MRIGLKTSLSKRTLFITSVESSSLLETSAILELFVSGFERALPAPDFHGHSWLASISAYFAFISGK